MSAIYDIAGTSNDTFMINGKATFIQGAVNPKNYQGKDGDLYLQSGVEDDPLQVATVWIKKDGTWVDMANNALPVSSSENKDEFLISLGDGSYGFANVTYKDGKIRGEIYTEVNSGEEADVLYGKMGSSDQFRVRIGGETDQGWMEIATGDNGSEPVYVRQYQGNLSGTPTVKNELTLLDANGYTYLAKQPEASNSTSSKQVPTIGWINDPTKSTNVVHISGTETITGSKTFTSNIKVKQSDITKGTVPSSLKQMTFLRNVDSENGSLASIYNRIDTETDENDNTIVTNYLGLAVYDFDSDNENIQMGVFYKTDGTTYAVCPEPPVSNLPTSTYIATTGWINDPAKSTNVVHRTGDETIDGTKTFTQTINGTALKAMWADLAEYYEADNDYPAGTLMTFGGDKEVTIATEDCNAVVSSNPALIMNGNESFEHPCLLALVGRVPVRVIGKVNKFDYLQLSEMAGVARVIPDEDFNFSNVIARALENKESEEEGLVLCVVKFEL